MNESESEFGVVLLVLAIVGIVGIVGIALAVANVRDYQTDLGFARIRVGASSLTFGRGSVTSSRSHAGSTAPSGREGRAPWWQDQPVRRAMAPTSRRAWLALSQLALATRDPREVVSVSCTCETRTQLWHPCARADRGSPVCRWPSGRPLLGGRFAGRGLPPEPVRSPGRHRSRSHLAASR